MSYSLAHKFIYRKNPNKINSILELSTNEDLYYIFTVDKDHYIYKALRDANGIEFNLASKETKFEMFVKLFNAKCIHKDTEMFKPAIDNPTIVLTPVGMLMRYVVSACIMHKESGFIIPAPRHYDNLMNSLIDKMYGNQFNPREWEEGFIDQWGNFLDRKLGKEIVETARQPLRSFVKDDELYSENLY